MRIVVLNGPNLNLLGTREPEVYGTTTLEEIDEMLRAAAPGHEIETFQTNHEGELIDRLHDAVGRADGILLNPGAFTHTSIAIRDAIEAIDVPVVEVHLSNTAARESFRRSSYVTGVSRGIVAGLGPHSYVAALLGLMAVLEEGEG